MDQEALSAGGSAALIVQGSSPNVAPNLHSAEEWFSSSTQAVYRGGAPGRWTLRSPPAGEIRCYLSDWGHRHQSLMSTITPRIKFPVQGKYICTNKLKD